MIIKKIDLKNFRNYKNLEIEFDKNTNILYGKNAQGKTNLLEACYISATTKSHKGAKDKDIIKMGDEESHICTIIEKDESEYRIDIHLRSKRAKGVALNRVPLKKAVELFGVLKVIFFSPEDLDIIKRGPEVRRKFLDMELCQIDKIYLNDITLYKKTLAQRNKLLKDIDFERSLISTLPVWNEKLVHYGNRIIKRRREFIKELTPITEKNYNKISGKTENLELFYEPNVTEEGFFKVLKEKEIQDIKTGQTNSGPHRDDMGFAINGMDARTFGSQGQQRTCALSLKLSEIDIIKKHTDQNPVLLLDDVLSELDTDRQRHLLNSLENVQTIMTCTGMDEIKEAGLNTGKVFIVDNATISEAKED